VPCLSLWVFAFGWRLDIHDVLSRLFLFEFPISKNLKHIRQLQISRIALRPHVWPWVPLPAPFVRKREPRLLA
jgi:hypothetical protein